MIRLVVAAGVLAGLGVTLLLAELRWFARPALRERLRPYAPSGPAPASLVSIESLAELGRQLTRQGGASIARLFGVKEDLDKRLRRVHSTMEATEFRMRQLAASGAAAAIGILLIAAGAPLALSVLFVMGAPLLVFLVLEQRVTVAARRWSDRVFFELPVVSEQLAMLLNAGFSLGSALNRIAVKGQGACATDLVMVTNRVRQGIDVADALAEWADRADVEALHRLVNVLASNKGAADIGRLVSAEARQARRDAQRRTLALIERRSEQVWIPVTVATLIPGVVLLAVPFMSALKIVSTS